MSWKYDPNYFRRKGKKSDQTIYRIIAVCIAVGILVSTWAFVIELIKIIF